MDDEDFDTVIDTNLKSAFVAIRSSARPMMRAKGGRIVAVGSTALRTIESAADDSGAIRPFANDTLPI